MTRSTSGWAARRGWTCRWPLAEHRFARAGELAARAIPAHPGHRLGDRVDRIATHRVAGPLLLFTVMYLVFRLVTDVSAPYVDWIDAVLAGTVGPWVAAGLSAVGLGGTWVEHLAVDGIVGGVGDMLAFVPVIVVLYAVLGLLEDSGYLARAAYLTDRAMGPMGLPGKSVLPLVVGFGCNVPALLAARVLDRPRDRLLTALLVPFVSCTARLPVYVLLAAALFPGLEGVVVLALYATSVAAVFAVGVVLRHTLMRGTERAPFVLELPPYRRPSIRTVWTQTRQRSAAFVRKAGTVILAASIAVWFLLAIPVRGDVAFGEVGLDDSLFGAGAEKVGVVFTPRASARRSCRARWPPGSWPRRSSSRRSPRPSAVPPRRRPPGRRGSSRASLTPAPGCSLQPATPRRRSPRSSGSTSSPPRRRSTTAPPAWPCARCSTRAAAVTRRRPRPRSWCSCCSTCRAWPPSRPSRTSSAGGGRASASS